MVFFLIFVFLLILLTVTVTMTRRNVKRKELFPGPKKSTLCVMACHASNELKVNTILNNIRYFSEIADAFVLIDSKECRDNGLDSHIRAAYPGLQYTMHHVPNDPVFLCHAKYLYFLEANETYYRQFERVILTNDSFLVCRSLREFGALKDKDAFDMVGLLASNEVEYHYPDFLRSYRSSVIPILIQYFHTHRHKVNCNRSLILEYEIRSTNLFDRKKALFDAEPDYHNNVHFDNPKLSEYIHRRRYPVIKLKNLVHCPKSVASFCK